jgi:CDP-diglyceride synthetase
MGVMKAKWIVILATAISSFLFFLPLKSLAQWNVGVEYNITFPFTDYGEVFNTGPNFNLEGKYHFNKGWGIGFQIGAARFADSKEGISFGRPNPKLTVVPILLAVEYETERKGIVRPFFAAGLGMSTYTFTYYVGRSISETSTSITISPQMGVRFFITKNTMCYLKGSYVFVMNGLPLVSYPNLPAIIFPVSGEATGYSGIAIGFNYRYDK